MKNYAVVFAVLSMWIFCSLPVAADCNTAPTALNDFAESLDATPVVISPLANDLDEDGDPLTLALVLDESTECVGTFNLIDEETVIYQNTTGLAEQCQVTYQATDTAENSTEAKIDILIRSSLPGIFADGFESGTTDSWELGTEV